MPTDFELLVSALTHDIPAVQQAHMHACECIACAQEVTYDSPTKVTPVARADLIDSDPPSSSPPSTPSTGSTCSKRLWVWQDDDDSDSDSEPDQKRSKTRSLSPNSDLRLPRHGDNFLDFRRRAGPAFVDKTECILQLPNKFRYLLLRPPQFGKTTFLSILNHYYDIHAAKHFMERFGPLAVVAQAPGTIPEHNQHLCLSFTFGEIYFDKDIANIADQLSATFSLSLEMFVWKYAAELQLSDAEQFLTNESVDDMFAIVFALVKARGHTLFVGVDAYDAYTTYPFARLHCSTIQKSFAKSQEIEHLLDSCFWKHLLAGSEVIDKLLVTGTFPLKSPGLKNLHTSDLRAALSLQLSCGFTEEEVLHFARSILDETLDITELRGSCGGYVFPSHDVASSVPEPVLHPQRLITRISELSIERPDPFDYSFELLSGILEVLPENSDFSGSVTVHALIDLLAAGAVDLSEMDAALNFDATAVPWTALVQAGALAFDRQAAHTLRVVNSAALSLIHARIDTFYAQRHDLRDSFLHPWAMYSMSADSKMFLEILSRVLCDLARASFLRTHEPNMHGVLELVMRNAHTSPHKMMDPVVLLLANTTRVTVPAYRADEDHVWDLNTLTLLGMWQATNLNNDAPTIEALQKLHEELVQDDDKSLLARPYRVWSPTLDAMETRSVGSFLDPEPEFPQFLAVGGARVLLRQRPTVPSPDESDL